MTGDESGDGCSARIEWWRLVAAREKSRPRERRGSRLVGEAKVCECEWSSLGDNGAGRMEAPQGVPGGGEACRVGTWIDRRRGVTGGCRRSRLLSSLEVRREASTMCGLGESFDGVPVLSDSERVLNVIGDRSWAAVDAASPLSWLRPWLS